MSIPLVPEDFQAEVQEAERENLPAKLILLRSEAQGSPWETAGTAIADQALLSLPPNARVERVILFTGHRVDAPGRKIPRFPASMEPVARAAIHQAVVREKGNSRGATLGIAGGANGGDILFLEVCEELGIPSEMLLTLPADQFIKASVENADPSWVARFDHQLSIHPNTPILAESEELPHWLAFKKGYDIWQRNNLWLLSQALSHPAQQRMLIALWDGATGDGPGGTEHMTTLAKVHGAECVLLKTKELFSGV